MSSEYENPFEILAEMEEDSPQFVRAAQSPDEPVHKKALTIVVMHGDKVSYHGFSKNKTLKWMLHGFATSGKELSYKEKRVLFALLLHPSMGQFLNNRHIPREDSQTHVAVLKKDSAPTTFVRQEKQKKPPATSIAHAPRKTLKNNESWQKYHTNTMTYHEIINAREDACFLSDNEAESVYKIWADAPTPNTTVFHVFCVDGRVTVSLNQ